MVEAAAATGQYSMEDLHSDEESTGVSFLLFHGVVRINIETEEQVRREMVAVLF